MDFYPILELQGGKPVSLARGRLSQPSIWNIDPVKKAKDFAREGASYLHVTDLDAVAGDGDNAAIIEEIILTSGLEVQVGGGIRTFENMDYWLDRGAARVVLGTVAVHTMIGSYDSQAKAKEISYRRCGLKPLNPHPSGHCQPSRSPAILGRSATQNFSGGYMHSGKVCFPSLSGPSVSNV